MGYTDIILNEEKIVPKQQILYTFPKIGNINLQ